MKRRQARLGATLLELLIACGLIFLVLYAATNLLLSCFRHYREVDTAAQTQQLAITAMSKLERELRDGSKTSFQTFTGPDGIVFGSPRQSDGGLAFDPDSLQPIWPKLVCFYLEPTGTRFQLIRKEHFLASPTDDPPTISTTNNTAFFQSSVGGGALIARGVESLTFNGTDTLDIALKVTEVSNEGASSEARFSVEVTTRVAFRN